MARLRYNQLSGTLGAPLTSSGTSITFASALTHDGGTSVSTITSPDYIPLNIDAGTASYEVVYLTAYTSGATTGTISRGQEGRGGTGVSHSNGAPFLCGPSALDVAPMEYVNPVSASSTAQTIPDPAATATGDSLNDITLTANCTFTFPTAAAGKSFTIILRQDGTGGRTVTWPTVTWMNGGSAPVLSTAANAADIATFVCTDGTNWLGAFTAGYFAGGTADAAIQAGVIGASDLLVGTISINTSTGALTFTPAGTSAGVSAWVKSSGGVLAAVTYAGSAKTITPSLPASTKYAVIGVEIDTTGAITLIKGADTATQLNTGSLIASNTPAVSSGKMRIADFAVWNNAGVYNFGDHTTTPSQGVNWIDRRPWARGFFNRIKRTSNAGGTNDYSTSSLSFVAVDSTNLSMRVECTGNPIRVGLTGRGDLTTGSTSISLSWNVDGSTQSDDTFAAQTLSSTASFMLSWSPVLVLTAGSHLIQPFWAVGASTTGVLSAQSGAALFFVVEELVRQNAGNGTA